MSPESNLTRPRPGPPEARSADPAASERLIRMHLLISLVLLVPTVMTGVALVLATPEMSYDALKHFAVASTPLLLWTLVHPVKLLNCYVAKALRQLVRRAGRW